MILIHISDLHIRKDAKNNRRVAGKLKAIEAWTKRTKKDWLLCVTGDIVDDGTEAQYEQARKLLGPFKQRMIMVPGNHDNGNLGLMYDDECHIRYERLESDLGVPNFGTEELGFTPYLIDSTLHSDNPLDFAEGRISDGDIKRLRSLPYSVAPFSGAPRKVVFLHHSPFDKPDKALEGLFLRLQNAREFLNATLGRVDLVLCGHQHRFYTQAFPGCGRPTRTLYVQAPALCNSDGQPVFIDTQNLKWICGSKRG